MPTQLDTGTGSQPAVRSHVEAEAPAYTSAQDPGLGSTPVVRYDNWDADADASRVVVGWNEGGGSIIGYQTWAPAYVQAPPIPGYHFALVVSELVTTLDFGAVA